MKTIIYNYQASPSNPSVGELWIDRGGYFLKNRADFLRFEIFKPFLKAKG